MSACCVAKNVYPRKPNNEIAAKISVLVWISSAVDLRITNDLVANEKVSVEISYAISEMNG